MNDQVDVVRAPDRSFSAWRQGVIRGLLYGQNVDRAARARVRVGLTSETSTEILEGLDVGETVVADAGTSLHDGDQIKTMFADELERTRAR